MFISIIFMANLIFVIFADIIVNNDVLEGGFTELSQNILILGCGLIYVYKAHKNSKFRVCNSLVAILFSLFFIRELDAFFDELFFHGAWLYICYTILLLAFLHYNRQLREIIEEFLEYSKTPQFASLVLGLVLLLVVSRIFGHKEIWKTACSNVSASFDVNLYYRPIKNVAEEGMELIAYGVLFLSAANPFSSDKN